MYESLHQLAEARNLPPCRASNHGRLRNAQSTRSVSRDPSRTNRDRFVDGAPSRETSSVLTTRPEHATDPARETRLCLVSQRQFLRGERAQRQRANREFDLRSALARASRRRSTKTRELSPFAPDSPEPLRVKTSRSPFTTNLPSLEPSRLRTTSST